jgi:hypothetical protein
LGAVQDGAGKLFALDDMDPTLCSHGVYEFAAYNPQTDAISHSSAHDLDNEDNTAGRYNFFLNLANLTILFFH